jgi:hypothetical protein
MSELSRIKMSSYRLEDIQEDDRGLYILITYSGNDVRIESSDPFELLELANSYRNQLMEAEGYTG